jgi:hypothetical protein
MTVAELRAAEKVAGEEILLDDLDAIRPASPDVVPGHEGPQAGLLQANFNATLGLRPDD